MNVKYYYEFKGFDNILNRVEILTKDTVKVEEIKATDVPFVLQYGDVKKLTPLQGSGATLSLISTTIFQFDNLHTDNMQDYLVKFYRGGSLYWMGWLDPELYEENLALYPPYTVEFTAADFNILERLKFTSDTEARYTDVQPMITQLKRCFNKQAIPFSKLYIGCTTTAGGITLLPSESLLHKLYIQSANFYDEEDMPMSCKEVIESILKPFGLMMVQRDASVYIYDYNTVAHGLQMKAYNFDTLSYIADENVPFALGDMSDIGFMSANAPYGFEEMINNVSITSSIYALNDYLEYNITEDGLRDLETTTENSKFTLKVYNDCQPWEKGKFLLYEEKGENSTLMGAEINYTGDSSAKNNWMFKNKDGFIISTDGDNFLRLKVDAYVNTRENPFDSEVTEKDERTRAIELYCDLVLKDEHGTPLMYYGNTYYKGVGWISATSGNIVKNSFVIGFTDFNRASGQPYSNTRSANKWLTNKDLIKLSQGTVGFLTGHTGEGAQIRLPEASGYIELYINYAIISDNSLNDGIEIYPADKVKSFLINNVEASLESMAGNPLNTDDYGFESYINKQVKADYGDVSLKCISANEDKRPIGKGNILYKKNDMYGLQLSFTRSGQTNILERLLLCTIHSNYTRKNRLFTVDLKTTENPAMRYSTFKNRWIGERFITSGCRIDFNSAITNLTVTNFSEDTDKLSDIPYE